jgi:hypothetical protein
VNHRVFFDWQAKTLGVTNMEDWYRVHRTELIKEKAGMCLSGGKVATLRKPTSRLMMLRERLGNFLIKTYYDNSYQLALASVYPEHDWKPWMFSAVPVGYWDNTANHRLYFEWLGGVLGYKTFDEWYAITREDVLTNHGLGLIALKYGASAPKAIMSVFSEHEWLEWRFTKVQQNYWSNTENRKAYLEWLASQLGVEKMEDWYNVTWDRLTSVDSRTSPFGSHFGSSLIAALKSVYSDHQWKDWMFEMSPRGFWDSDNVTPQHVRDLLEQHAAALHITEPEDWYRVSFLQLTAVGIAHIIQKLGGLAATLSVAYPEREWQRKKMSRSTKRSSQKHLRAQLQSLFPDCGSFSCASVTHPQ